MLTELLSYRESQLAGEPAPGDALRNRLHRLLAEVRPDLIRRSPAGTGSLTGIGKRLRQVVGDLVSDNADPALAAAGLRSAGQRARQVTFVSDVADLDLEIVATATDGQWSVSGQLGFDGTSEGLTLWFIPADQVPTTADIDPATTPGAIAAPLGTDGSFQVDLAVGAWTAMSEIGDAVVLFRDVRI